MPEDDETPQWIDSRPWAAALIAVTVWMAQSDIRNFIRHQAGQPGWLHSFDGVLPHFTGIALHWLGWAILVAALIETLAHARGAQRVYFPVLFSEGILQPLRLLPPPIPMIVLGAMVIGDVVMIIAAIRIFLTVGGSQPSNAPEPS